MVKTVNCPTCGAPLEYSGQDETILCPYCKNSVLISNDSQKSNQNQKLKKTQHDLKRTQDELKWAEEDLEYAHQANKNVKNAPSTKPYQGSNIQLSRLQAILVGLGLIALSLLFPIIFIPLGIMRLLQNDTTTAVMSFIFAAAWFLGWGIPGVLYIINKLHSISVSHRTY